MFEVYAQDYRITIQEIPLGNQGEDMARCLVIDITDAVNEFGSGGTVSVRNKRNGDELPYFCTNVSTVTGADAEGNVHTYIKWTLTDVDTAAAGSGFVQADYIISGVTVKTWVYKYFILPSLGITGDVPDPYEDILEEIEAQVAAVQTAAASAAASAAQASAEATRIISTTQQVVEDWLSDHIVTGYTVDDTLTISGAAADSKKAGDMIRAAFITEQTSGSIASFTDGADGVPLNDLVVNISPVQSGTGDPSPTNVRSISGWDNVIISRTGKNLLNGVYENKSVSANGDITNSTNSRLSDYIPVMGARFIASIKHITDAAANGLRVITYDANKNFIERLISSTVDSDGYITRTVNDSNVKYIRVQAFVSSEYIDTFQVEFGATRSDYEATGAAYPISLSSAGTVYGGTLDVTSGMLTVTHGYGKVSDYNNWSKLSSGFTYYHQISGKKFALSSEILCDKYKYLASANRTNYSITGSNSTSAVYITNDAYTTPEQFMTAEADTEFVYELAQPVSYQLTPTEIKTILGNNNIFADTGSVASCEYRADTKLYIEHLTDPNSDMVADSNITSGSYIMVGNSLYLATSAIAAGATIIPGTNCTATNLAAALNAINS